MLTTILHYTTNVASSKLPLYNTRVFHAASILLHFPPLHFRPYRIFHFSIPASASEMTYCVGWGVKLYSLTHSLTPFPHFHSPRP